MNYVERRFLQDRNAYSDRRSGMDRRVTARQLGANLRADANRRHNDDRRSEDRRVHCMHCGTPYEGVPGGVKVCICRVIALRGASDI